MGEKISVILDEYQKTGIHNKTFKSKEIKLKKGIYILKVSGDDFEMNRKVVLN